MHKGTTYIIGAGLAGLSAATTLASQGRHVVIHEAASQAGGRCRSYHDAVFDAVIDNGNHLLLSGNDATLAYLERIGSDAPFLKADQPIFEFVDAKTYERWSLHLNKSIIPWWLLSKNARIEGTQATDYFSVLRLLWATPKQTITSLLNTDSVLYKRLWHTLMLSALNTDPAQASAKLAGAIVRGTLLKGGSACIPLVADGLSQAFIEPALHYLTTNGAQIHFNSRVRAIDFNNDRATTLQLSGSDIISLAEDDNVICAVPAWNLSSLMPNIDVPDETNAILNVHFRASAPASFPAIMGVVNGITEWIFAFEDRISITISNANTLMQEERDVLARRVWREVSAITGLDTTLPPWQIVKEKRATFAATPEQDAKRPEATTPWNNITLAGDYVQTGLPATIEGAVRSGVTAAQLVMRAL